MKNNMFCVFLLFSIGGMSSVLFTADINSIQYSFNDFDKNLFSNFLNNDCVELIYPTPLIESISSQPIIVQHQDLECLLHPALTRIVYRKCCPDLFPFRYDELPRRTLFERDQLEELHEEQDKLRTHLNKIYDTLKTIQLRLIVEEKYSDIPLPANHFMLLVQYAALKITHQDSEVVIHTSDKNRLRFSCGDARRLLEKYRSYEQNTSTPY